MQPNSINCFGTSTSPAFVFIQVLRRMNGTRAVWSLELRLISPPPLSIKRYTSFKAFEKRILVATDIFGRGIDVERVNIVINYDASADADSYLHRVGLVSNILFSFTFHSTSIFVGELVALVLRAWQSPSFHRRPIRKFWSPFNRASKSRSPSSPSTSSLLPTVRGFSLSSYLQ